MRGDMKEIKLNYEPSSEAVSVFRIHGASRPSSRIPLLIEKRKRMTDQEDIARCNRTLRALRTDSFF